MEIKIQAVHFDATEKLQEFTTKKVEKLSRSYEDIKKVEVQLKNYLLKEKNYSNILKWKKKK